MNIWDIVVLALIAAAVIWAVRSARGMKKRGGCSCGSGCTGDCAACQNKCK